MVSYALDEIVGYGAGCGRAVDSITATKVVDAEFTDGVGQYVHLHLQLVDHENHGEHHARDASEHGDGDGELGGVHGRVPGGREPRPRRPHAEYERGRRFDVAAADRPHHGRNAHQHVGHRHDGTVRAHESREERVGRGPPVVVPELAAHQAQHHVE